MVGVGVAEGDGRGAIKTGGSPMSVKHAQFNLVASHGNGPPVLSSEFLVPLAAVVGGVVSDVRADGGKWSSGKIVFGQVALADFAGAFEPPEHFAAAMAARLDAIAGWMEPRVEAMQSLARAGLQLQFIVELWMDQDQMDLHLPPRLMAALGKAGIVAYVLSNE